MPVRKANLKDLSLLAVLLDEYRCFYGQPCNLKKAREFLQLRLELRDSYVLVYDFEDGADLDGFVQLYPIYTTVRLDKCWILNDLFVTPSTRRHGIGRELMGAAAKLAREHSVSQLKLSTQVDNAAAKTLYESLGWQWLSDFDQYTLSLQM
ncbi:GNAT family N-acetyltransferase [Kushneria aurantia]|uniref:GNAT family N-acetyltransferase n=1 Tax=Kushneria aurantia TaxID=504092 RepID=A0ABV6FZ64_9GAMM|nr:GNAT family N-acetyltransferase [Kushneria aurantia]